MTTTERVIKSFSDQPDMWYGFAGAECWANKDEPLYTEISQWLLVADKNGVGVYGDEEKDQYGGMMIQMEFPSQKAARAFLAGLPEDFNPVDFGATDC